MSAFTARVLGEWQLTGAESGGTPRLYLLELVGPTSYDTGGSAIDVADNVRLLHIDASSSAGGYIYSGDPANQKIKAFRQKDPAAAGGADIPLPEVGSTVNLSGETFQALALGD
jgi:hypothetical protein